MKKAIIISILFLMSAFVIGWSLGANPGASNFTRLVLGDDNIGEDPNPTADITGQNDEYISNASNGAWNFGSANITTTGVISAGSYVLSDSIGGKLIINDSLRVNKTLDVHGSVTLEGANLTASSTVRGTDAFTTTATEDTVTISGAASTDIYIVSGQYNAGVDQQDVLQWEALTGKLVVHRLASGESGGKYSWFRIK